jgi:hypothetical protein
MAEIPPWLNPVDTTARYVQGLSLGVDIAQRDNALQQQAQQAAAQLAARREEAAMRAAMVQAQSEYQKNYQMQQLRQAEQRLDFAVGKERERLKAIADMNQETQALVASGMKLEDAAVQAGMKHLQKISPTAWASMMNKQAGAGAAVGPPIIHEIVPGVKGVQMPGSKSLHMVNTNQAKERAVEADIKALRTQIGKLEALPDWQRPTNAVEALNVKLTDALKERAALIGGGAAPAKTLAPSGGQDEVHRPTTREEFDAIAPGQLFINPADGRTMRKK